MSSMFSNYGYMMSPQMQRVDITPLQDVTQQGINLAKSEVTDETYKIWFEYSYQVLTLLSSNSVLYNQSYREFGQTLEGSKLLPREKMIRCLELLINIMKIIIK